MFHNGRPVNMNSFSKPSPMVKTIEITMEEAYTGLNKPVEIERWININGIKKFEKEKIYVPIPAGIDNQEIIVLKDKGNILNENIRGDIKIYINVKNNTKFARDGLNLIYKQKITLKQALIDLILKLNTCLEKHIVLIAVVVKIIVPQYTKSDTKYGNAKRTTSSCSTNCR